MKNIQLLCKILIIFSLSISFVSCKKEIVYEGLKGELKGKVILYDPSSNIQDYSGVLVTVDGSSPILQTPTNEKGEYVFENLQTGIYDIVFTKENFGTFKIVSSQFIGGNVPTLLSPVYMYKLSDVSISDLKVDTSSYYNYYYSVEISGKVSNSSGILRYYISTDPDVSYVNYQATDYIYVSSSTFGTNVNSSVLSKFPKGKQLYLKVYPSSGYSTYIDINTGNTVYPVNLNKASAIIPFMIPNVSTN